MLSTSRLIASALLLGLAAASVAAEDRTYDLRGPGPKADSAVRTEWGLEMRDGTIAMSAGGMNLTGSMSMRHRRVWETTTLEVKDGEPTKVRRKFVMAVREEAQEMMGQRQSQRTEEPLHEKTVIGSREEGKWTFKLEEGEPNAEQREGLKELAEEFKAPNLYPERAVRVGESWDVTGDDLRKLLGSDEIDGNATFTLQEVQEVEGETIARLNLVLDVHMIFADAPGGANMHVRMEGPVHRSLKSFLDTRVELRGTMLMELDMSDDEMPGMGATMRMNGPMQLRIRESAM